MNAQKRCPGCRQLLPLSDFGRNRALRDGLTCRCRDCHREDVRRWRQEHPEYAVVFNERRRMARP